MKVYVIIVTHNPKPWLRKCLDSLLNSNLDLHPIIVDNHSEDGSVEIIKNEYPDFHLIELGENVGFAEANNMAMKKALSQKCDFVFLLNQDAWIEPNTIENLVSTAQEFPEYGVLSPIHMNRSGELLDFNYIRYISNPEDEGRNYYSDLIRDKNLQSLYRVNFVNAAAWLISRECLMKVGFFEDQLFKHYDEDRNYIQRATFHNFKTGIVPDSLIFHDREDRNGTKIKTKFSLPPDISHFILNGSNILDDKAVSRMKAEISMDIKRSIKEFLFLNFKRSGRFLKSYRTKKQLLPLILACRKKFMEINPPDNFHE